ncbi:hypothetical protein [Acetobacter malorum]|uniref:hypothetical protein n=1 Tax=Acetobacter malorum TaxID=178901 RepID=UPI00248DCE20|nr:hypothetical protein [Acetobacter malorum]
MSASIETSNPEALAPLNNAYAQAMAFNIGELRSNKFSSTQLLEKAQEEASFGQINVDSHGVTSGMRMAVLSPVEEVESHWRGLVNQFDVALQPFKDAIDGVKNLQKDVDKVKKKKEERLASIDEELKSDPKYHNIDENYQRSRQRYNSFRDKYQNRSATMFCKTWIYPIILFLVLLTECFVNYHSFNMFWGVPAVALGTTIILGVLLALAAHLHGELVKQWSYLFAPSRSPAERWSAWRMFGIAGVALTIVLGFTGWARWAAAMEAMHGQDAVNVLGGIGIVQVNPMRDVLISLIANLGAWMVGVIISYAGHDPDPEYMVITKQFQGHQKAWEKMQAIMKARRQHVVAAADKEIEEKENAVSTRLGSVKAQMDMLNQIELRDSAIMQDLEQAAISGAEIYRDAVVKAAIANKDAITLFSRDSGRTLSPFDYKNLPINLGGVI